MSSDSENDSIQDAEIEMDEEDDEGEEIISGDEAMQRNLDESDTSSSDEDTELDEPEFDESLSDKNSNSKAKQTKEELAATKILDKYTERQGKQLFILFPQKLPLDEKELQEKGRMLSPLVINVHRPRQKYARFCLVDFESKDDRDKALKNINSAIKKDAKFKGIVAKLPRTEDDNFVKNMVERKIKSIESKRAKIRLKRANKQPKNKIYTSSIIITNLPKSSSLIEVRKLFPNAVDIQVKPSRDKMIDTSIATVTLTSTQEASAAIKKKLTLSVSNIGTDLLKGQEKTVEAYIYYYRI
ncbi:uncharacterized protein LOC119680456 [Teleopsis dalmanni]|uniref:uncharacterized protein LOC119680456 n=1 Tax=Teleopsis dalmanni TaxID=139649 RepID=UPI0018CED154|nr:uncharacterized protein LOC119680456 [Teleopsis dalmanni]